MLSFLKNHPFAVEAFFESSFVLTFAVPKKELELLIPPCLTLDTFNDKWAFIAVAMVQTTGLRPKGFPKIFGNDFFLIGYRIFVQYNNNSGKRLRGLYILESETDKKKMAFLGNIFTHYNYTTTDIIQTHDNHITEIKSIQSKFKITFETPNEEVLIIEGVRQNWKPNPVKVIDYNMPFLHDLKLNDVTLANAFVINNIPYYWKKGKIEKWNQ